MKLGAASRKCIRKFYVGHQRNPPTSIDRCIGSGCHRHGCENGPHSSCHVELGASIAGRHGTITKCDGIASNIRFVDQKALHYSTAPLPAHRDHLAIVVLPKGYIQPDQRCIFQSNWLSKRRRCWWLIDFNEIFAATSNIRTEVWYSSLLVSHALAKVKCLNHVPWQPWQHMATSPHASRRWLPQTRRAWPSRLPWYSSHRRPGLLPPSTLATARRRASCSSPISCAATNQYQIQYNQRAAHIGNCMVVKWSTFVPKELIANRTYTARGDLTHNTYRCDFLPRDLTKPIVPVNLPATHALQNASL